MNNRDWGFEAQQVAEHHLDACNAWAAFYDEGEPEGERPAGDDPAVAPYCGCQTCIIRETLHAAWPVIDEAVRSGDFDSDFGVSFDDEVLADRIEQLVEVAPDRWEVQPSAATLELAPRDGVTPVEDAS